MLNINHNTEIDTVGIQLDFESSIKQRATLNRLTDWIIARGLGSLHFDMKSTRKIQVHNLYHSRSKIATLSTGATTVKDKYGSSCTKFYIRLRFAGLKSYNVKADNASYITLMTICAFLNTTGTQYRFVELDVCIDINCSFKHVLAVSTQRTARTLYNNVGSVYKGTTSYLEYFKNATIRKQASKQTILPI